jgi:hypothetical protein
MLDVELAPQPLSLHRASLGIRSVGKWSWVTHAWNVSNICSIV